MKLIDRIIYFIFSSIIFVIIALAIMGLYDIEFAKNIIISLVGYLKDFSAISTIASTTPIQTSLLSTF